MAHHAAWRPSHVEKVLPAMLADELVDIGKPDGNRRKPYFITQKGRDYLAQAVEQGLSPEIGDKEHGSSGGGPQQAVINFIRKLPEFEASGEARLQEVSRGLADAIGIPAQQTARGDAEHSRR